MTVRREVGIWVYQRALLKCLVLLFTIYCVFLGIPHHVIVLFLILVVPCLISPQKACYSIPIPLLNGLRINYCGFLLPLKAAIAILVHGFVNALNVVLLTSISIVFASLHMCIARRMVLVNVVRYCISFIAMSFVVLHPYELLYVLPFAVVVGLAIGSDLIPYVVISIKGRGDGYSMVVGGLMALDAIAISFLFTLAVLISVKVLASVSIGYLHLNL